MPVNPSVIEVSTLNGVDGFRIDGATGGESSGNAVASAGDLNGDGFGDIIIGASGASPNGSLSGSSYVVFGKSSGFSTSFSLSDLDGSNGFRLDGAASSTFSGRSVASAGDLNNDGFDDLIIGADGADASFDNAGSSYVVFGKASGFVAAINLSELDGSDGFRLDGAAASDYSGGSVASAGDVNGDGIDDVIIGASGADPNDYSSGASYVIFGQASSFPSTFDLGDIDGTNGFRLDGVASADRSGCIVSSAGDVNGDGYDDVIVSAVGADPNGSDSGSNYVVFGKASGFTAALNLSSLDGSNGFRLDGVAAYDYSGFVASSAGDINGDGFDDLIIGAMKADNNGNFSGSSYVVFGQASGFSATFDLAGLDGTNGFRLDGETVDDLSGNAVSSAGDVNGDGFDDLLIGAKNTSPNGTGSGSSYVVFGKANGFTDTMDLSALDGTTGFKINGQAQFDALGFAVSSAGDVNGDGFDDLVISARYADFGGSSSGSSYVIFGRATAPVDRTGTNAANSLFGGDYNDSLRGLAGKDTLSAGAGNDVLNGGTGNDTLLAGAGLDFLRGGTGADTLTGGADSDLFKFSAGETGQSVKTMDKITDFEIGALGDKIDFSIFLSIGGTSSAATSNQASINATTGVATFFGNSGKLLADALNDIATSFTSAGDAAGDFALFQLGGTGAFHVFISDGNAGVTANDVLVQLTTITSIGSINLSGGDLTILS